MTNLADHNKEVLGADGFPFFQHKTGDTFQGHKVKMSNNLAGHQDRHVCKSIDPAHSSKSKQFL